MMRVDEAQLPYFHGAMLDQDVDALLQLEGDFLIQTKFIAGSTTPRNALAVRSSTGVKRLDIRKNEQGTVKLAARTFANTKKLVETHMKEPIIFGNESILLKRAISKGKYQLQHADVRMNKKIGSGAYGTVFRGTMNKNQKIIAIKRLDFEKDGADQQGLVDMMKEARVMQLYDHANIVRFFGFIVDRAPYLLVMEFCEGGSVEDKLRKYGEKLSVALRVDMCAQAATGLEYLHSKECIHRDIAARNCLIDRGVVKMADFGMCRPVSVYKIDLSKPLNVRWLAPEVWRNGETRYNTDIYAFGVMLWEMFEIPYECPYSEWKAGTVKQKVMAGYRMTGSEHMPVDVAAVMALAWNHQPEKRPDSPALRKMLDEANKRMSPDGVNAEAGLKSRMRSR